MAKFKVLVLGDSFALLDKTHSHWIKIWANRHGGTTEHMGYSGDGHVSIVNKTLHAVDDWSQYAAVFYCITDFLRLQAADPLFLGRPEAREIPYNDHRAIDFLLRLNNDLHPDHGHDWHYIVNGQEELDAEQPQACTSYVCMPRYYGENSSATLLYDNISLRWLASANVNSMRLLASVLQHQNVPLIGIQHAWDQGTAELLAAMPNIPVIWKANTRDGQHHTQINYATANSSNHVEIDDAVTISKRFEAQVYAKGLFTLRIPHE